MKRYVIGLLTVTASVFALCSSPLPIKAQACDDNNPDTPCNILDPACKNAGGTLCQESQKQQSLRNNSIYGPNGILTRIVRIISIVVGIASVFVIIAGGLRYITASGDPNSVNGAKNTILYAMVGLVIAAIAQILIIYVLRKL